MKILYSAIFGNYDILQKVKVPEGWRAIVFTDGRIEAKGWEVIRMAPAPKLFRKIKICPHLFLPPHDISIWVDGNITPQMPLNHLIKNKEGFWLMAHPTRKCLYKEAVRCIELRKDDADVINAQVARYRAARHPENDGMVATGVMVRGNGYDKFNEDWWTEVEKGSVRDQISFNYVARKHQLNYHTFPFLQGFGKQAHASKMRL